MAARFAPLASGDPHEVGGYPLCARLGAGGMGRVYLAFTPGGRALAIKVVRPEYADDEEFRRRFQREVATAQRVQGLYTAPVVDADTKAPLPWLATAYVPGPTLRQAVADHGPLPPSTVLRLLAGVAEGLAAVHACDIIHRDLTPANVLLADDGPRVIDFGIAHAAAATSLTRTGLSIGTPAFLAPEQVRGRAITPAVDVFALGHLVVFAATGHAAFGEGNQEALFYRILNDSPNVDDCPHELRAIALRCLAKEPDGRPTLTEVMEYATEQTQGQTRPLPGSWLPAPLAATFDAYDTVAYAPAKTKRVTETKVDKMVATTAKSNSSTGTIAGDATIPIGVRAPAPPATVDADRPDTPSSETSVWGSVLGLLAIASVIGGLIFLPKIFSSTTPDGAPPLSAAHVDDCAGTYTLYSGDLAIFYHKVPCWYSSADYRVLKIGEAGEGSTREEFCRSAPGWDAGKAVLVQTSGRDMVFCLTPQ
jgi:eukaryotic-like serine/threonine-protein kinase